MNQLIVLEINDKELTFDVSLEAYNKYMNEMQPTNKVAPSHTFVMRTVTEESKDDVRNLLKKPGAPLQLAGKLVEEFTPDLTIVVGKSKESPSE